MRPNHTDGIIPEERLHGVSDRAPLRGRDLTLDEDVILLARLVPMQPYRDDLADLERMNFVALLPALIGVLFALSFAAVCVVKLMK